MATSSARRSGRNAPVISSDERSISNSRALRSLAGPKGNSAAAAAVTAMDIDDGPITSPSRPIGKSQRTSAASPLSSAEPMEVSPCAVPKAPTVANQPLPLHAALTAPCRRDDLDAVEMLRSRLMYPNSPGWSSSPSMPLRPSLQDAHDELVSMMERVVSDEGSTSSVLLLGARGTGKTLLVERALQTLASRHNPTSSSEPSVGVVRISGLLHLEERAAFQEIARQLCLEFKQTFAQSATYDENLVFLRTMLQALHRCMKTVVFVLDELDAFTRKGKQVLLYNLLDTLAHSKVQACVVGVSCMQDVMDHMEKRVKSRFSHRRILIKPPTEFEPRKPKQSSGTAASSSARASAKEDLVVEAVEVLYEETPLGILQTMLTLPESDREAAGPNATAGVRAAGERGRQQQQGARASPSAGISRGFVQRHNKSVASALSAQEVKNALLQVFNFRLCPSDLSCIAQSTLNEWASVIHTASPAGGLGGGPVTLDGGMVLRALDQHYGAFLSQVEMAKGLSVLQLFLAVAMYRINSKTGQDVCNFEMVYGEYRSMQGGLGATGDQCRWGKAAAGRAFQGLAMSGLVAFMGSSGGRQQALGGSATFAPAQLRVGRQALDAALEARKADLPDLLMRFFKLEV